MIRFTVVTLLSVLGILYSGMLHASDHLLPAQEKYLFRMLDTSSGLPDNNVRNKRSRLPQLQIQSDGNPVY